MPAILNCKPNFLSVNTTWKGYIAPKFQVWRKSMTTSLDFACQTFAKSNQFTRTLYYTYILKFGDIPLIGSWVRVLQNFSKIEHFWDTISHNDKFWTLGSIFEANKAEDQGRESVTRARPACLKTCMQMRNDVKW